MARWKNFSIWRGRLPHWRADDVLYYATFRHRRPLEAWERQTLLRALLRPEGDRWTMTALRVGTEETELMFWMRPSASGKVPELADVLEKAKMRAGKHIVRKTGERSVPFYSESFDRIVRDEEEREERLAAMIEAADGEDDFLLIATAESSDASDAS
ncbi:MAG: hypothetical protein N2109_10405 [Fimbriimonadales bacterium]|nr:hypothetical protein [Fimbriimonadales bacterium]